MKRKEIKELALDIVMYGDDLDPYAFTKEDLVSMALDTYEDLLNEHIENYISAMEDYLHEALEDKSNDCCRELSIIGRLLKLRNE